MHPAPLNGLKIIEFSLMKIYESLVFFQFISNRIDIDWRNSDKYLYPLTIEFAAPKA